MISQLFVTFLLGLLEALASIGFFIGTVLHLVFVITYLKVPDTSRSTTATATATQRGPSYRYYPETEVITADGAASAHFSAPLSSTS